jgi:catechol 2,3-dioxygenase-like lactoylglutathione lyase family enzyme
LFLKSSRGTTATTSAKKTHGLVVQTGRWEFKLTPVAARPARRGRRRDERLAPWPEPRFLTIEQGVRADIAMMQTPDGHGRLELTKFHTPANEGDRNAPANTPGIRHIALAVEDIDAVVAGLRARGAELVGELERYEDSYRLCYVRGPEGIIIELAERIG